MLISKFALASALCLGARAWAAAPADDSDAVLKALGEEVTRSTQNLKSKGDAPLYYLSYRVRDGQWINLAASYGVMDTSIESDDPLSGRVRFLDVAARVGSPKLDNTHKLRGGHPDFGGFGGQQLPIEDDTGALQVALWRATDHAYKNAVKQLIRVKTNKTVKVEEEDDADDFSKEPPQTRIESAQTWKLDKKAWRERLRHLSALFKDRPLVLHSQVALQGGAWTSYFVDSDGSRIREPQSFVRIMISGAVKADDGMDLNLYKDYEAVTPEQLPSDAEIETGVRDLISRLLALRTAPVIEPYSGPAIVTNRAAAVFFHEIFGHRVEGHRQKDSDEGHTFTKKVNEQVVPSFISVVDDPTREKFGDTWLNGHYLFDDEGVRAQPAKLVDNGVLKGFLMGRSPIKGFAHSNGHGRAQAGLQPVSRQGNLLVSSSKQVSFQELRQQLIQEVKKRGKPYGLVFEDISGGFTLTRAGMLPQAFKVLPLVVKRVYPDGRPDELVRGVDIVGTPLQSFEKILATGNDFAVFNGVCGAESGWVPVSAVAPSLLVGEIEVEKQGKSQDRPPLLPPPLHPAATWPMPVASNPSNASPAAIKEHP
jgi:TldD protein